MIPEWKTIKDHGVPDNNRSVMFVDKYGIYHIGYFRTMTRGQYKGGIFVESRTKNESNGMYGSYVHKNNSTRGDQKHFDYIVKWDYLPEE